MKKLLVLVAVLVAVFLALIGGYVLAKDDPQDTHCNDNNPSNCPSPNPPKQSLNPICGKGEHVGNPHCIVIITPTPTPRITPSETPKVTQTPGASNDRTTPQPTAQPTLAVQTPAPTKSSVPTTAPTQAPTKTTAPILILPNTSTN